jgi:Ca2+-binding RTX toxin-like protein
MTKVPHQGSFRRGRKALIGAAVAVTVLSAPAVASAASTVQIAGGTLGVVASSGEANNYLIRQLGTDIIVFEANGNTLTPGPGCSNTSANRTVCGPVGGVGQIAVNSGDLNDTIDSNVQFIPNYLNGSSGDDTLKGIGQSQADTFVGGSGTDVVSYAGATYNVWANLNGAADDGVGVVDWIQSDVEGITGGTGDDHLLGASSAFAPMSNLTGGPGNDILSSAGGNTRMLGEDGNDSLIGGAGIDWLTGGNGLDALDGKGDDDIINVHDAAAGDTVKCGAGADILYYNSGDTQLDSPNCESIFLF